MNRSFLAALCLTTLALVACHEPPPPKTVAYYAEHTAERDARLAACKNNPGELKKDPDCMNAAASVFAGWTKRDNMPPITFAPASAASR